MRVVIIGAGIIGCALAYRLARNGSADVTVIDRAAGPAAAATGASFGWINASYFLDEAHFRLREAGIAAWRSLQAELGLDSVTWPGALWWEAQGDAMDDMDAQLVRLGYEVARLDESAIAAAEPALAQPPTEALKFAAEGVADPVGSCRTLLDAAVRAGARCYFGVAVEGVSAGRVETAHGNIEADKIVVAAGTGSEAVLRMAGVALPMLPRPGVIVRSAPVAPMLNHVLVTPQGEIRQDADGRLVMPATIGHQSDGSERLSEDIETVAENAMARLRGLLKGGDTLRLAQASLAWRPVPQDGLPVIGACGDGLYAAVMHSGVTLAAIAAELAAAEVLEHPSNRTHMFAPYRPERFALAR